MQQQYDNSQAVNLSKDRSSSVLAAIKALEDEGFYPGSDDIDCDIKTVTTHGEWEIKAGYSDVSLYITVALKDGSRWIADLENCEDEFPSFKRIVNGNPVALGEELPAINQKKYHRMMQAIAWVKELVEVRSPKPEHLQALIENGFQCLGNAEEHLEIDTGLNALEIHEFTALDGWHLFCFWHEDNSVFLDAIYTDTRQLWQKFYPIKDKAPYEEFESLKQLLRGVRSPSVEAA